MPYTVSDVARLAGVSVRTLHHYDEIGLLVPAGRSEAGYRLYEQNDLERLQQVLFFRELGFSLEAIGQVMAAPDFDRRAALVMQRQLMRDEVTHLSAVVEAIDRAIAALDTGAIMTEHEMFEVFGDQDPRQWDDEALRRWGQTEAHAESKRRTARYGKDDWKKVKAEGEAVFTRLGALLAAGRAPTHPEVMSVAEEHRLHIDHWFYPCGPELHRGLGELYVNDPRFAENLERVRPGLAHFAAEAFAANAARARRGT
jgi:DNA-binding transcriptional MerR regulator